LSHWNPQKTIHQQPHTYSRVAIPIPHLTRQRTCPYRSFEKAVHSTSVIVKFVQPLQRFTLTLAFEQKQSISCRIQVEEDKFEVATFLQEVVLVLVGGERKDLLSASLSYTLLNLISNKRASPRSGSGSDSSVSTPLSAVTAPQGSGFFSLLGSSQEGPPVLNTLIEDSSLKFDEAMNCDMEDSTSVSDDPVFHSNILSSPHHRLPVSQPRNEDWMRSVYMTADASKLR
jgi:hypothetical protein